MNKPERKVPWTYYHCGKRRLPEQSWHFLRAECDRMVGVVKAARELVEISFGRTLTPAAVRRQVCELERRLVELDQGRETSHA